MTSHNVLVVEDDEDILDLILYTLRKEGFRAEGVATGEEALQKVEESPPDLILLDLMLPGMDGLEVCRIIRAQKWTVPIPVIMVTAKTRETDQVVGLEMGADDYIVKPFTPSVLVARIKAVLRRQEPTESHVDKTLRIDDLHINFKRHEVLVKEQPVSLTRTEFNLLKVLVKRPGWVFSREQILDHIKGGDYHVTFRSIDFHILRLRKKLGHASRHIETVRGVGYRFRDKEEHI